MYLQLSPDRASFVLREEWKKLQAAILDCEVRIAALEEQVEGHRLALTDVEEGLGKILPGWVERMREGYPKVVA